MSGRAVPRAPTEDGAVVCDPPLSDVGRLLDDNRRRLHFANPALAALQGDARRSAVEAARAYLERRGEPVPGATGDRLILAGHQPELFHPGVWVKSFALNGLARRHGLTPINLVIDNDTVKATSLRLPARAAAESAHPHAVSEPFDRWTGEIPWEERGILDPALFAGFADRATALFGGWPFTPMLPGFWADVRREAARSPLLGECLAGARRSLERRWGCANLELPVSVLCGTAAFARFACGLLAELPRFHAVYNDCVHTYRRRHGIRSRNHPVPDLAAQDGWLEAPFWGWRAGAARRGRLFARTHPDRIELRIGDELLPALPGSESAAAWAELERRGWKVRSRALTNTLYARLFLSELFVHGIGGAKYDELTDEIIRLFYDLEPPAFLVLSATRLLPLPAHSVGPEDHARLARELRDLRWNPQRHLLTDGADVKEKAARKQALIAEQPADASGRRRRFLALRGATEQLRPPFADAERRVRSKLAAIDQLIEANRVLRRRDYAFCLYPQETLRPFCSQFL